MLEVKATAQQLEIEASSMMQLLVCYSGKLVSTLNTVENQASFYSDH